MTKSSTMYSTFKKLLLVLNLISFPFCLLACFLVLLETWILNSQRNLLRLLLTNSRHYTYPKKKKNVFSPSIWVIFGYYWYGWLLEDEMIGYNDKFWIFEYKLNCIFEAEWARVLFGDGKILKWTVGFWDVRSCNSSGNIKNLVEATKSESISFYCKW